MRTLSRPYGLAFDSQYNLVLVDADPKNPLIYTFERESGNVIRARPYQPVIQSFADQPQLTARFGACSGQPKPVLGNSVQPFSKSKVRFIGSYQDSLYAADLGRSLVFRTDIDGNLELAFGQFGKRKGDFNEPSGIHVDSDGLAVLVGDSKNDRIQVISIFPKFFIIFPLFSFKSTHFITL